MFDHKYQSSDELNYITWFNSAKNELRWCLRPRRCYETNKLLWLKLAYRSRNYYRTDDLNFIPWDRWFDRNEFLILMLKV